MASKIEELKEAVESAAIDKNPAADSKILIQRDEGDDVITKTDLTNKQVKAVTSLRVLAEMTGNELYGEIVNTFMNAQISLRRQSRREFIQNNQSIRSGEEAKGSGAFSDWWTEKV